MKVEEAKTKVCPFMSGMFEYHGNTQMQNCICGDCIAWVDTTPKEVNTRTFISKIYPTPEKQGYCVRIGQ